MAFRTGPAMALWIAPMELHVIGPGERRRDRSAHWVDEEPFTGVSLGFSEPPLMAQSLPRGV